MGFLLENKETDLAPTEDIRRIKKYYISLEKTIFNNIYCCVRNTVRNKLKFK